MSLVPKFWRSTLRSVPLRLFSQVAEAPQDPVVNLERARHLFSDKYGLHSKIDILSQKLKFPDTPVRVGLIGSQSSVLNSILADPFASDQTWYQQFQQRSAQGNVVVKFNASFESSGNVFNVPSPFLHSNNLEFVELRDLDNANDRCHCYLAFQDSVPLKIQNWPLYKYTDISPSTTGTIPVLAQNEICSAVAEEGVNLLIDSPTNATTYTRLYIGSQISQLVECLTKITEPYTVVSKLYNAVRKNLCEQNSAHSMTFDELAQRDTKIRKFIAEWDQESHREFQTRFKPYVSRFEASELPWWKLYYRADDVQAIMAEMLKQGILMDSLNNYSYIKGQIDSFTSFQVDETPDFRKKLNSLVHNDLTTLKRRIVQEDLVVLQNKAVKILMKNFLGLQLPFLLLAIPGVVIYDFSLYSMCGLASLGLFIGFNRISKQWLQAVDLFKQELFEKVRLALLDVNKSLYHNWSMKYEEEKELIYKRHKAIEAIKNDLGL